MFQFGLVQNIGQVTMFARAGSITGLEQSRKRQADTGPLLRFVKSIATTASEEYYSSEEPQ